MRAAKQRKNKFSGTSYRSRLEANILIVSEQFAKASKETVFMRHNENSLNPVRHGKVTLLGQITIKIQKHNF